MSISSKAKKGKLDPWWNRSIGVLNTITIQTGFMWRLDLPRFCMWNHQILGFAQTVWLTWPLRHLSRESDDYSQNEEFECSSQAQTANIALKRIKSEQRNSGVWVHRVLPFAVIGKPLMQEPKTVLPLSSIAMKQYYGARPHTWCWCRSCHRKWCGYFRLGLSYQGDLLIHSMYVLHECCSQHLCLWQGAYRSVKIYWNNTPA